jgi:translocator protein
VLYKQSTKRIKFESVFIQQETAMGFFQNYIVQIVIACAIPFIGAWSIGFSAQRDMHPWYDNIVRPSWGPPDWVFGPVWTFLYLAMGYASFRVWSEGQGFSGIAKIPLILYIIQLLLNWTWT